MNIQKPHFWYQKSQRNGVLLLLIFIVIFQLIIWFYNFKGKHISLDDSQIAYYEHQLDSLRELKNLTVKPKFYPFNPNYIDDFKGEQLGMNLQEIDRLHQFRAQGKFVYSAKEFQQVTHISDSLLSKISPNFKFPDWVVNKKENLYPSNYQKKEIIKASTTDINNATKEDLMLINGIGDKLSDRIINYREKLQGFSFNDQIYEVWGLDKEVAAKVIQSFKVISKPNISKININTATFKEVLKIPYIDYQLCKQIFDYKDQLGEFLNISQIKAIPNFPQDKYERIVLYLHAE